jgi:hypothetical protein
VSGYTLAIDPGNIRSAYCLVDPDLRPIKFGLVDNWDLLDVLGHEDVDFNRACIEMVASYGMPVGAEVFDTCVWIGRFTQRLYDQAHYPLMVKRQPIKLHHCHSTKANDATVKQALVDRFAKGERNHGKGTKAAPGWFYGFSKDVWQAYALAVYALDTGGVS